MSQDTTTDTMSLHYSENIKFILENIGIPLPIVPKNETLLKKDGKPLFNGKSPSYYKNGKSTLIYHREINSFDDVKEYFNTDSELNIGTKITKDNICVIDIDCKEVPELKNKVYQKLLEYKPELKNGYVEQTANKGYHLIVKTQETSTYFPFTVKGFEQYKIGEILRCGRFVVNAPSSGYKLISGNTPLEIESLASLGIIQYIKPRTLSSLYRGKYSYLIQGECRTEDRSEEYTGLIKGLYALRNKHKAKSTYENYQDDIDKVIQLRGESIFKDDDRVKRILESIDENNCNDDTLQNSIDAQLSDTEMVNLLVPEVENILKYSELDSCWFIYDTEDNYWKKCQNDAKIIDFISNELQELNIGKINLYNIKNCEQLLRGKLITDFKINLDLIPLSDCVINVKTNEIIEHSPELLLTYNVGYPYSDNSNCPLTKQWLLESVDGIHEKVEVLRAYLNCIVKGKITMQRYLHLQGSGENGKSIFTKLASALVGEQMTHTTKLQKLEENRFETAALKDKKLCLINDSESYGGEVSNLKNITGNDSVTYETKGIQQGNQSFTPMCMVLITSNDSLRFKDTSTGLKRRRLTIHFDKVPKKKRELFNFKNNKYEGELVSELPQVLNWVLSISDEKVERLIKYTEENVLSLVQEQRIALIESSPLAKWADECIVFVKGTSVFIGNKKDDVSKKLYPNYCDWCESNNLKPVSNNKFSGYLYDTLKNQVKIDTQKLKDKLGAYFTNIRIRTLKDEKIPTLVSQESLQQEDITPVYLLDDA